jgi:hypothetical protein
MRVRSSLVVEHVGHSCEPGIYLYGVGSFRHGDMVIVGAQKPEVIMTRSKRLEDQIAAV